MTTLCCLALCLACGQSGQTITFGGNTIVYDVPPVVIPTPAPSPPIVVVTPPKPIPQAQPRPRTAVCQCQGYKHALCFCLKAGIKCGCHATKGSVWNLNTSGRAVSKTGEYVDPNETRRPDGGDSRPQLRAALEPSGSPGFHQQQSTVQRQGTSDAPTSRTVATPLPVVYLYTATWCAPCQEAKRGLGGLTLPFRIEEVPESKHPSWLRGLPTFHWQDLDGTWRYWTDWRSLIRVWKGGAK